MKRIILKRILQAIPILVFISLVSFYLIRLAPGDPVNTFITPEMSEDYIEQLRSNLGLDKPIIVQYFYWLKNILKGNFGYSYINHQPVSKEIITRIPATFGLMGASMVLSLVVSIPLGLLSAMYNNKFIDWFISKASYIGISIPSFWLSIILIYIFSSRLRLLPSIGMRTIGVNSFLDIVKHGILPCISLSFSSISVFTRYIRANAIAQLNENYVEVAYAKGLSKRIVLYRHVLKNSLLPVITILGMSLPSLVSGAFITETIFGWPGMGRLGVNAIFSFDYPVIMAITMISSVTLVLGNLLADIAYYFADPRIKY